MNFLLTSQVAWCPTDETDQFFETHKLPKLTEEETDHEEAYIY